MPLLTTDASGAVASPTGYTMLGFPGQTRTLADLYYNRYRDYDSSLGRYIQADPIGLGGEENLYLYAAANPLRFTDPLGLESPELVLQQLPQLRTQGAHDGQRSGEATGGLFDFLKNYFDMRDANTKKQDKYFHCKANCEAAKRGRGGRWFACHFSNLREIWDQNIKGDTRSDSMDDQRANWYGRNNAGNGPCEVVCSRFRPNGLPKRY